MSEVYDDIAETCPHCDYENWYPEVDMDYCGWEVQCQKCGKSILLCSICRDPEEPVDCDWREERDGRGWCFRKEKVFESKAKALINSFSKREYGVENNIKDVSDMALAYTDTAYEGRYGLQVNVNIPACSFEYYVNARHVASDPILTHEGFLQSLEWMDFAELISPFDYNDPILDEVFATIPHEMEFMLVNDTPVCLDLCNGDGGLNISMYNIDNDYVFDDYADMTVRVRGFESEPGCALVDVNNYHFMEDLIERYHLGVPTGRYATSGFNTYPEYKFDLDTLLKYTMYEEEL